jgi:hypothetical protein
MADNIKCDWCNNYGGRAWTRTNDKKKFTSKQKFCSLKCLTEFEDRRVIEWIEIKEKKGFSITTIIIIMVILYFLSLL